MHRGARQRRRRDGQTAYAQAGGASHRACRGFVARKSACDGNARYANESLLAKTTACVGLCHRVDRSMQPPWRTIRARDGTIRSGGIKSLSAAAVLGVKPAQSVVTAHRWHHESRNDCRRIALRAEMPVDLSLPVWRCQRTARSALLPRAFFLKRLVAYCPSVGQPVGGRTQARTAVIARRLQPGDGHDQHSFPSRWMDRAVKADRMKQHSQPRQHR